MKFQRLPYIALALFLFTSFVSAQKAEVTVSLNEQFFEALLDAVFQNGVQPEFPIAADLSKQRSAKPLSVANGFTVAVPFPQNGDKPVCSETIKLLRENNNVRTAVRFRDGKIYAPIAFSGNYNPPLIGCVEFSGYAETNIDLEFDQQTQRLVGRAKALNVSLNGTGGIGSSVITRLVQSSIDKKFNPLEIMRLDKLSFLLPIQNSSLRMQATGITTEIANGTLNIRIAYEFTK